MSRIEEAPLEVFRPMAEFFSFGTSLFFLASSVDDSLKLSAWSLSEPVPQFDLSLEPPLRLRLIAGLPQVLTGEEKWELAELASTHKTPGCPPVALPLVTAEPLLLGTIVLLDAPLFDLEEADFSAKWEEVRRYWVKTLYPALPAPFNASLDKVRKSFVLGKGVLKAQFDLKSYLKFCEDSNLPGYRQKAKLESALRELAGETGYVSSVSTSKIEVYFVLPPKTDQELFMHQIDVQLDFPPDFTPKWNTKLLTSEQQIPSASLGQAL